MLIAFLAVTIKSLGVQLVEDVEFNTI